MTDSAEAALEHLRDSSQFQWYVIPLLLMVLYVYSVEVERRNWSVLLGGLAFWGMDWFNEIWNSAVFHATGKAPVWGAPGDSAYQILIGLNIEISFMFAIMGIVAIKILPADKNMRILGINNRVVFACVGAGLAVAIEILLNQMGVLTWEWSWWSAGMPILIFLFGYLPFFAAAYLVHDMTKLRHQITAVSVIFGVDAVALVILGTVGWL
ncbi:MAG: hypothetical protein GX610_12405 [Rhodococcus sp.]|nr:hypothetical protein [Rhodococcus sp. (in: high G+C Gram-positive bacteria)]